MRLNISVPDELAARARAAGLPISKICQQALRDALGGAASDRDDLILAALDRIELKLESGEQ